MIPRADQHQSINGKGLQMQSAGIDGIGQNTDFSKTSGDTSGNLNALALFQVDIGLRVACEREKAAPEETPSSQQYWPERGLSRAGLLHIRQVRPASARSDAGSRAHDGPAHRQLRSS